MGRKSASPSSSFGTRAPTTIGFGSARLPQPDHELEPGGLNEAHEHADRGEALPALDRGDRCLRRLGASGEESLRDPGQLSSRQDHLSDTERRHGVLVRRSGRRLKFGREQRGVVGEPAGREDGIPVRRRLGRPLVG
jgi:hypothetical protein